MSGPGSAGDPAALRAARLARLRGAAPAEPAAAVLRFRRPGVPATAAPAEMKMEIPAEAPAVAAGPACDLDRLPGAGPGLVWALRSAGFRRRADLARLGPEELAARLGPLGALAPAAAWIADAREVGAE